VKAVLAAALASLVLVAVYLAAGGGDYEPGAPPDPCRIQTKSQADGLTGTLERVGLNALAGSACELKVPRERLLLALAGEEDLGIDDDRRNESFRTGLRDALRQEQDAGNVDESTAFLLDQAIGILPVDAILDRLFGEGL